MKNLEGSKEDKKYQQLIRKIIKAGNSIPFAKELELIELNRKNVKKSSSPKIWFEGYREPIQTIINTRSKNEYKFYN